jgi:hypothetical protein
MKSETRLRLASWRTAFLILVTILTLQIHSRTAVAASWSGIEPLKSNRADVERILGKSKEVTDRKDGTLRFKVSGGMVTILFADLKFVTGKKLYPAVEGTVLQIVLQHEGSTDTPESLGLAGKKDFESEKETHGAVYRNLKDGIAYTFVEGKLKTTRYFPTSDQLVRARKG